MRHLAKLLYRMYRTQYFILVKLGNGTAGDARQEILGYIDALDESWQEFNNNLVDEEADLPGLRQMGEEP